MTQKNYYDPLSDTGRIKDSLMSLFCGLEDLTHLVMPTLDNENFTFEENWYGGKYDKNIYGDAETVNLTGHCFDTPYIEGAMPDNRCAIFIETYLTKVENRHIKEVGVDIAVVCHKDSIKLSNEDTTYYNSIGIYGNRIDSAVQVINSSILNHETMNMIQENYSIGGMNLSEKNSLKQYASGTNFYGKCLSYTYQTFYQRKSNIR